MPFIRFLPIYMINFTDWLIGFVIFTCVAGFVLSLVFQLAHTVEHTAFPVANVDTNKLEDEWAVHQIKTTANFATNNPVVSWLVGGLNSRSNTIFSPRYPMYITLPSVRSSGRPVRSMAWFISSIPGCGMPLLHMWPF